jgi:hypothetical protein
VRKTNVCVCIYFYSILFYFILFYSILFYSILFYFILFYSILFYFILFYSILFYSILFYSILFYSILFHSIPFHSILLYSILLYSILFYGGPVPGSHGGGPHANVPDGGGVELSREDVDDPVGGGDGQLAQHGQAHQQAGHVLQEGCGVAQIIALRPAVRLQAQGSIPFRASIMEIPLQNVRCEDSRMDIDNCDICFMSQMKNKKNLKSDM